MRAEIFQKRTVAVAVSGHAAEHGAYLPFRRGGDTANGIAQELCGWKTADIERVAARCDIAREDMTRTVKKKRFGFCAAAIDGNIKIQIDHLVAWTCVRFIAAWISYLFVPQLLTCAAISTPFGAATP